jgi:SAM-dependent methyltransferase
MIAIALRPRRCPICGGHESSQLFAEANVGLESLDRFAFASRKLPEYMHWRLEECRKCDVLYADPAPSPDDLAGLYGEADFDSSREAGFASRTYGRMLSRIVRALPDRKSAVDIGTGDGAFLRELLAAGFENVAGVEPSRAPIEAADPSIRPLIRHDCFCEDLFAPESVSLITCFQTIEHLSHPLEFCAAARRALKLGGGLFLIGHNRRAFSAKVLGRKSPIYDIEHMQLFSPESLRHLLENAGFSRVRIMTVFNRYPIQYWARLFPLPRSIKQRTLQQLESLGIGRLVLPLPAGNVAAFAQRATR